MRKPNEKLFVSESSKTTMHKLNETNQYHFLLTHSLFPHSSTHTVGQWEDVDEDDALATAELTEARDKVIAQTKREERVQRGKRQLSEYAAAAVAGKKKKVKGGKEDGEEYGNGQDGKKSNPFETRQMELQEQKRRPGSAPVGAIKGKTGGGGRPSSS